MITTTTTTTASKAKAMFGEILGRAAYGKERIIVTQHGKNFAALVPIEDLEALEAMEDRLDSADALKISAAVKAGKEKTSTLEEVRSRLKSKAGPKHSN